MNNQQDNSNGQMFLKPNSQHKIICKSCQQNWHSKCNLQVSYLVEYSKKKYIQYSLAKYCFHRSCHAVQYPIFKLPPMLLSKETFSWQLKTITSVQQLGRKLRQSSTQLPNCFSNTAKAVCILKQGIVTWLYSVTSTVDAMQTPLSYHLVTLTDHCHTVVLVKCSIKCNNMNQQLEAISKPVRFANQCLVYNISKQAVHSTTWHVVFTCQEELNKHQDISKLQRQLSIQSWDHIMNVQ